MENIIEVKELSKSFKGHQAVDKLSFTVKRGDIYGFLGENGAGKSTTIRMMLGLIHPTGGDVFISGENFKSNRKDILSNIGAMIERPDLYNYLTGWNNLKIFASLSKKKIPESRFHEVLKIVGLTGREQDKVRAYSQGMKQRLGLAIALLHDPNILLLDEPTNGLDPQGIAEVRELILRLGKELGKTIVISSHLLHEIEQVANRMLIIHKGKKVAEGEVAELLNPDETLVEVRMLPDKKITDKLKQTEWGTLIYENNIDSLIFKMHPKRMPELNRFLVEQDVQVLEIRSRHSLEEYFLSLTNNADVKA